MFALLLGCFAIGAVLRRVPAVPPALIKRLNQLVLSLFLPALVLKTVHVVAFQPRYLVAAAVLWSLFALAAVVAIVAVKRGWSTPAIAGAAALSTGLGNTAFIGVPLSEALGGPDAVGPAAMIDQLGSFLVFAVGAVPFAMTIGGAGAKLGTVVRRIVTFPPFLALAAAVALRPFAFPPALETVLGALSKLLTPTALVCVGWQLDWSGVRGNGKVLALGLGWKLLGAPAVMLTVLLLAGPPYGLLEHVAVGQAAMAPMVTAAVLAAENELAASVSAALAAVGAVFSFATVPLWFHLAERVLH